MSIAGEPYPTKTLPYLSSGCPTCRTSTWGLQLVVAPLSRTNAVATCLPSGDTCSDLTVTLLGIGSQPTNTGKAKKRMTIFMRAEPTNRFIKGQHRRPFMPAEPFNRPFGTCYFCPVFPALKRRATFENPFGTVALLFDWSTFRCSRPARQQKSNPISYLPRRSSPELRSCPTSVLLSSRFPV